MRWQIVEFYFNKFLNKINNPVIILVYPGEWDKMFPNYKLYHNYGRCSILDKVLTCRYRDIHRRVEIQDTLWHEILHIFFPSKPHWWIVGAALRLTNQYIRPYELHKHGHKVSDIPNRKRLIHLMRAKSERFKYYRI
jgi:hypothetical protein